MRKGTEITYVGAADVLDHQTKLPELILVELPHQGSVVSLWDRQRGKLGEWRTNEKHAQAKGRREELTTWLFLVALVTASPLSL